MTLFIRSIILLCLLQLLSVLHSEIIHKEGLLLCRLQNLPHRGTGMLFYAHMKFPWRADFLRDYATQYLKCTDEERLLEGMTRPVVPMMIVREADLNFYNNGDMQALRYIVMHNHFQRLKKENL